MVLLYVNPVAYWDKYSDQLGCGSMTVSGFPISF